MTTGGGNGGVKKGEAGEEATGLAAVETTPTGAELDALRRERDDLRDQLLRKRADFENFRKRVERDKTQAAENATAAVLQALIPSFDNLDRALATDASEGPLRHGLDLIQREVHSVLESQGITTDDPTGRKFDPEIHQALSHETVSGFADGTVVEVFRKAYFLKGRLLRPALVKVAKDPDSEGADDGPDRDPVR